MYYRLLMLLQTAAVSAFVTPPRTFAATQRVKSLGDSPAFLFPPTTTPSILLSDADADALQAMGSANPILEGIKTLLVILTAIAFALFGLSYVTAAVLIPKAAEQLEREAKELAPDLWDEYQTKLGPGETIATRPDLLQELGNKIQPLIEQKVMREAAAQQQGRQAPSSPEPSDPPSPAPRSSADAIDVEIIAEEDSEEPKH